MIFLFILWISLVSATSSSSWYNTPIMDWSISFKAELKDWKVYTSWTKYNKNEGFKYYKVIRSQTVSNPIYPDNWYIKYSTNLDYLNYVDEKVPVWTSYYRVCAITTEKNRYCSNVVKIINNSQNVIFKVGPKRVDCTWSFPQKCLIINWKYFYDIIVWFAYEEWYNYKIEVKKELLCNPAIVNDCPQDAGIYKYSLVKIIYKEKDTPKVCTMEYAPVCWLPPMPKCPEGVVCKLSMPKEKTYSNKCMLEAAWAKFLHKWECKDTIKPIWWDKDEHGCYVSAWYTWCSAKNKCIRPWEEKCKKEEIKIPKNCTSWYDWCNTCSVKDGKLWACTKRYCLRQGNPKCLKFEEKVKPVEVTDKLMKKADLLVDRFIKKLETKYKKDTDRERVLKIIIKKLDDYKEKKPSAEYLIDYINKKFREKILDYQNAIDDIENILNQY